MSKTTIIVLVVAIVAIIITLVVVSKKPKDKEEENKDGTASETDPPKKSFLQDLAGQSLDENAANAIGVGIDRPGKLKICKGKCGVVHPFNKSKKESCRSQCDFKFAG